MEKPPHEKRGIKRPAESSQDNALVKKLWVAARDCNLIALCEALAGGVDVNTRIPSQIHYDKGKTALHRAAGNKSRRDKQKLAVILKLLQRGADVNLQDDRGGTALGYATVTNSLPVARLLLKHGAQINLPGRYLIQTVSDLLPRSIDGPPLLIAISQQQYEMARLLLQSGADANMASSKGFTPLHMATQTGNIGLVRELLLCGAAVNAPDGNGNTPLFRAVDSVNNNGALVRELVLHGALVNARNDEGMTPLLCATTSHRYGIPPDILLPVIRELLAQGADPDVHTERGENSIDFSTNYPLPLEFFMPLIEWGAHINLEDQQIGLKIQELRHQFPLFIAAALGELESVQELVTLATTQEQRDTALVYAASQRHLLVVNWLLGNGAQPARALHIVDTILNLRPISNENRPAYQAIQTHLVRRLPLVQQVVRRQGDVRQALIQGVSALPDDLKEVLREHENRAFTAAKQKTNDLLDAAKTADFDVINNLLEAGADINAADEQNTPVLIVLALAVAKLPHHGLALSKIVRLLRRQQVNLLPLLDKIDELEVFPPFASFLTDLARIQHILFIDPLWLVEWRIAYKSGQPSTQVG